MEPFVFSFPDVGERETRSLTVFRKTGEGELPEDEYSFVEFYCHEKGCDCRRVMISMLARGAGRIMATINMGFDSGDAFAGPFLDGLNPQSEYADTLMRYFLNVINNDPAYLARLQRHYAMVKEKVEGRPYDGPPFETPGEVPREVKDPDETPPTNPEPWRRHGPASVKKTASGKTSARRKSNVGASVGWADRPGDEVSLAKRLVRDVRKRIRRDEMEAVTPVDIEHIKKQPRIVLPLLRMYLTECAHGAPGKKGTWKREAMLTLLEEALTHIRYSVDRNRSWALELSERFQKNVARGAFRLGMDVRVQTSLMRILHDARLEIHPDIKAKRKEREERTSQIATPLPPPDLERLFAAMEPESLKDPFEFYDGLMAQLGPLTIHEQLSVITALAVGSVKFGRDVATFAFLHPDEEVRTFLPHVFEDLVDPAEVTPVSLRRMIGVRNWVPEEERPPLDNLIENVRRARVACASMPFAKIIETRASPIDGSGCQMLTFMSRGKKEYRLGGALVRQGVGVLDAWGDVRVEKPQARTLNQDISGGAKAFPVREEYVNRMISHCIHIGLRENKLPPVPLLRMAESMGGDYWRPRPLDIEEEFAALEETGRIRGLTAGDVDEVLEESIEWPTRPITDSWFEDDSEVDEALADHELSALSDQEDLQLAAASLLDGIIEDRRDSWRERLLWMALWARAQKGGGETPWWKFFIVARELHRGASLYDIPLMIAIAARSVQSAVARISVWPS